MDQDPFQMNILGVANLVGSDTNKTDMNAVVEEGIDSDPIDILELPMSDDDLLDLRDDWETVASPYTAKIKPRQQQNKKYYLGHQLSDVNQTGKVVSSNLIFEAVETFIPQALAKNPEPVVWSDNTEEGKTASNDIKTMLQFHADILCLRRKLGVMVRHWSTYFLGVAKHGWDSKINDIKTEIRNPENFILDPNGYVDEYGNFVGKFLGERIESTAEELMGLFPAHKAYILIKANGKAGTSVVRTEWWTDEYCFVTFLDEVLDKHKNELFKYGKNAVNHFSIPKMPYTFLSVFSLQQQPHDITNLIEQNVPNQDRITERDLQITKNLQSANNAVKLSGLSFTAETASQAVESFFEQGFLLIPDGNMGSAERLAASPLPNGILEAQSVDKDTLRSIFGTQGLTPEANNNEGTARGMILNQSHDSSRIGGGIGDALEQVADNIFNWWLQLYYVFYDEKHYGAIMGNGQAVEYVALMMSDTERRYVVSVSPNSMQPKDEISEQNLAISLYQEKALDPITLFKKLNYPDPMETAKQVSLWATNPQLYMQTYFPEQAQAPDSANPPQGGGQAPQIPGSPPQPLSQEPANASLSSVPLSTNAMPA